MWDSEKYPKVTKEAVLAHGQYCLSGVAYRKENDVAVCISIDKIKTAPDDSSDGNEAAYPFECKPDGKTMCHYYKGDEKYFSLHCQCGLLGEGSDAKGFCPIPDIDTLQTNIYWMRKMWLGDNCHTLDRTVFEAQLDCGIGKNQFILSNATQSDFKVTYF